MSLHQHLLNNLPVGFELNTNLPFLTFVMRYIPADQRNRGLPINNRVIYTVHAVIDSILSTMVHAINLRDNLTLHSMHEDGRKAREKQHRDVGGHSQQQVGQGGRGKG